MNESTILFFTVGCTATGKTSISHFLSTTFNLTYISQGEIKRSLVAEKYSYENSLSEELRDKGYTLAIKKAASEICYNSVLVDASFHKRHRRIWLLEALSNKCDFFVILKTKCANRQKIEKRIKERVLQIKNHNNQADSMEVYDFIQKEFQEIDMNKLSDKKYVIFEIDTDINEICAIIRNGLTKENESAVETIRLSINDFLYRNKEV